MIEIKHRFSAKVLRAVDADNLQGADLRGADLQDADLRGADLRGADLRGADLRGADLWRANLPDANLQGANLPDANLRGANLWHANLRDADLRDADLQGADLRDANLQEANLRGVNLRGANLRGATYGEGVRIGTNPPLVLLGLTWDVYILADHIRIGCQIHRITEWAEFDDERINGMESRALEFWKTWREPILQLARTHQEGQQ